MPTLKHLKITFYALSIIFLSFRPLVTFGEIEPAEKALYLQAKQGTIEDERAYAKYAEQRQAYFIHLRYECIQQTRDDEGCNYKYDRSITYYRNELEWVYQKTAKRQDPDALFALGYYVCPLVKSDGYSRQAGYTRGVCSVQQTATEIYTRQAEAGNTEAMLKLYRIYKMPENFFASNTLASQCLTQAAEAGNVEGQYLLGINYFQNDLLKYTPTLGVKWLTQAAEKGHKPAQEKLISIYKDNNYYPEVPGDPSKVFYWTNKLKGTENTQIIDFTLADKFFNGSTTVKPDYAKACDLYIKTINQIASVDTKEGLDYLLTVEKKFKSKPSITPQYEKLGLLRIKLALLLNDSSILQEAYTDLGLFYVETSSLTNEQKALDYALKAINAGAKDYITNFLVGEIYEKRQDYQNAFKYYQLANSELKLGEFYLLGKGVQQNYDKAYQYFISFIPIGDPRTTYFLGVMNLKGLGMPIDPAKAYAWFTFSAFSLEEAPSFGTTKDRQKLKETLSPSLKAFLQETTLLINQDYRLASKAKQYVKLGARADWTLSKQALAKAKKHDMISNTLGIITAPIWLPAFFFSGEMFRK